MIWIDDRCHVTNELNFPNLKFQLKLSLQIDVISVESFWWKTDEPKWTKKKKEKKSHHHHPMNSRTMWWCAEKLPTNTDIANSFDDIRPSVQRCHWMKISYLLRRLLGSCFIHKCSKRTRSTQHRIYAAFMKAHTEWSFRSSLARKYFCGTNGMQIFWAAYERQFGHFQMFAQCMANILASALAAKHKTFFDVDNQNAISFGNFFFEFHWFCRAKIVSVCFFSMNAMCNISCDSSQCKALLPWLSIVTHTHYAFYQLKSQKSREWSMKKRRNWKTSAWNVHHSVC